MWRRILCDWLGWHDWTFNLAQTKPGRPARPIHAEIWGQALEQIIQRPPRKLPPTSHGYLKSIAYDLADESDRRTETARNQAEASGSLRADLAAGREREPEEPRPVSQEAISSILGAWRRKHNLDRREDI